MAWNRLDHLKVRSSRFIDSCNIHIETVLRRRQRERVGRGNLWIFPQCYVMYAFLFLSILHIIYIVFRTEYIGRWQAVLLYTLDLYETFDTLEYTEIEIIHNIYIMVYIYKKPIFLKSRCKYSLVTWLFLPEAYTHRIKSTENNLGMLHASMDPRHGDIHSGVLFCSL